MTTIIRERDETDDPNGEDFDAVVWRSIQSGTRREDVTFTQEGDSTEVRLSVYRNSNGDLVLNVNSTHEPVRILLNDEAVFDSRAIVRH